MSSRALKLVERGGMEDASRRQASGIEAACCFRFVAAMDFQSDIFCTLI